MVNIKTKYVTQRIGLTPNNLADELTLLNRSDRGRTAGVM